MNYDARFYAEVEKRYTWDNREYWNMSFKSSKNAAMSCM